MAVDTSQKSVHEWLELCQHDLAELQLDADLPPTNSSVERAARLLAELEREGQPGLPLPHIFTTYDSGVGLRWRIGAEIVEYRIPGARESQPYATRGTGTDAERLPAATSQELRELLRVAA